MDLWNDPDDPMTWRFWLISLNTPAIMDYFQKQSLDKDEILFIDEILRNRTDFNYWKWKKSND